MLGIVGGIDNMKSTANQGYGYTFSLPTRTKTALLVASLLSSNKHRPHSFSKQLPV